MNPLKERRSVDDIIETAQINAQRAQRMNRLRVEAEKLRRQAQRCRLVESGAIVICPPQDDDELPRPE